MWAGAFAEPADLRMRAPPSGILTNSRSIAVVSNRRRTGYRRVPRWLVRRNRGIDHTCLGRDRKRGTRRGDLIEHGEKQFLLCLEKLVAVFRADINEDLEVQRVGAYSD